MPSDTNELSSSRAVSPSQSLLLELPDGLGEVILRLVMNKDPFLRLSHVEALMSTSKQGRAWTIGAFKNDMRMRDIVVLDDAVWSKLSIDISLDGQVNLQAFARRLVEINLTASDDNSDDEVEGGDEPAPFCIDSYRASRRTQVIDARGCAQLADVRLDGFHNLRCVNLQGCHPHIHIQIVKCSLPHLIVNESHNHHLRLIQTNKMSTIHIGCYTSVVLYHCDLSYIGPDLMNQASSNIILKIVRIVGCDLLTHIDASNYTNLEGITIEECRDLVTLDLRGLKKLHTLEIKRCKGLTTVMLADCVSLGKLIISKCYDVSTLDLSGCSDAINDALRVARTHEIIDLDLHIE